MDDDMNWFDMLSNEDKVIVAVAAIICFTVMVTVLGGFFFVHFDDIILALHAINGAQ